jgi:RNA polymerase sigma-70 factor (ECF subfamily)
MDASKQGTFDDIDPREDASGGTVEAPEVTALVLRAKAGDPDAFADLMRLYERRIVALGLQMGLSREDALDACQEAFIKVFKYIGKFESGRRFFKWLYRIAIHAVYDQLRRSRGIPTVPLEELETTPPARDFAGTSSIHDRVEASQIAARVRESLGCLTRQERIVFVLRDLQDLGTDEIGSILGVSQITVRRHCMSARQKMRDRIFPRRT